MSEALARENLKTQVYFGGAWKDVSGTFPVLNPVTGEQLATAPLATVADVDAAVKAAAEAQKVWGKRPHAERAAALRALADELEKRKDAVASVEALNTGKPFREAQGDVDDACAAFRYCARRAEDLDKAMPQPAEDLPAAEFSGKIRYEPVGVVAAIAPWNFPLMMAAWKVGPSLAAGCTVIVKPSEFSPFSSLCLAEAAHAAGIPAGVLSVLTGYGDIGAALTAHALVDKVTFTGSVPTGSKVMASAAAGIKRVTLELGGKSPAIVFADANIDAALEWLFFGFAWNCGQICSATTRLLLHESVADEIVSRLAAVCAKVKIGGPFDEGVECGPIQNGMQYAKVKKYIDIAIAEGCKLVAGGPEKPAGVPAGGFHVSPTIFTGVTKDHTIFREEIFGPVAAVSTFKTEEEAIELANATDYGLAAAIFSGDAEKANRVAAAVKAGTVWINNAQPSPHAQPWGGFKKSGIGREMGPLALLPFLEPKAVTTWAAPAPLGWYPEAYFQKGQ